MKILHLTHTEIKFDPRILKEMQTIANHNKNIQVNGIGVSGGVGKISTIKQENLYIDTIVLKSKKLTLLPKALRHLLSYSEMTFKMLIKVHKFQGLNVVHCNDTMVLPIGVVIKLITGAKLIYDAHELESDKNGISKILGKMTLFVEKKLWKFVDALIVVSQSIERWYKVNIGEKYTEVVLNSPILENNVLKNNEPYLRKHFGISKESKIFLYIGILNNGRGIDLITEVFKNPEIKSSVIFLGFGELSDELKSMSEQYSNIYIHDAVPHDKVVSVARSADVGLCFIQNVSLSDYYCLPNKLFEYCFAEIPVLASDFPDISETVTKYNLGRCSKLDVKSVFEVIKEIENTRELQKIDIEKLYELSWGAQEEKLIRLYNKLLCIG